MTYIGKTREPSFFFHADQTTVNLAKRHRRNLTYSEKLLWARLRRKNILGVKFRKQHPIEFFIADFYCHEVKLVIEVDGPIHNSPEHKEHDDNRTAEFERLGLTVIRFTNDEIKNQIESVIKIIRKEILKRLSK